MKPLAAFLRQTPNPITRPQPPHLARLYFAHLTSTTTTTSTASRHAARFSSTITKAATHQQHARLTSYLPALLRRFHLRIRRTLPTSRRGYTTKPSTTPYNPTPSLGSPEPALSLSQRMKKLSREYGWSALGVYLLLSALDFPFCFLAVRLLGTDRIGRWEHAVVDAAKRVVRMVWPQLLENEVVVATAQGESSEPGMAGWGVEEAEERNKSNATLWTQLALAYAIHKSFIFVRVPLTAAVTPKVVKVLRGWGWNIGKRRPKTTPGTTPPTNPGA